MKEHRNIKFYSVHDFSAGSHLHEVEEFFRHWDENIDNADVNVALELCNIKKFIDAGMRLKHWSEEQFEGYGDKCREIPSILGRFCSAVSNDNLEVLCKEVDRNYTDDFWQLLCDYKVYRRICPEILGRLMDNDEKLVWHIMQQRDFVISFGQVIADHLSVNSHTADRLISHFLAAHERNRKQLHFPTEFTPEMKKTVLEDFVEREEGNINSLQLLEGAQSTKELPVSDRLKLKARKKKEELQKKLFDDNPGMRYGAKVTLKSMPNDAIEESYSDHVVSCTYSREWVEENRDYPTLLNNFIYLFRYVDRYFRCAFVSLQSELGTLERHLGIKGKKDYVSGIMFNTKRILSLLQMAAYNQELHRLGIRLEEIFKWFFEDYLKNEFGAEGFTYTPPSAGTTQVEKCKLLAIAIDGILKQYRLFCEDGFVNRELLEMSSGHVVVSSLSGTSKNKYAYAASNYLQSEIFLLFSDQSMMNYTERTGSKYETLPELLLSEHIKRENFAEYQHGDLDWLIERGSVTVAEDGYLSVNKERVFILKDLFENEVICPTYFGKELQQQVETLVETKDLQYESTLFSKPEQDYLNYILNRSEFSNGLDLRNKYSHDTCPLNEEIQRQDYLELQKIMVLTIIKINEEFCIKSSTKTLPQIGNDQ